MKRKIFLTLAMFSLLSSVFATNIHKHHHHAKHTKPHYMAANKHAVANLPRAKVVHPSPFTATKVVSTIPAENINQRAITNQPKLYSYSAMAVNINSGEVLVSKNPTAKLPIASITKLMTAMVALDANLNLDGYITISTDDIDKLRNTSSRLKVGMQFKRRDLLLLALMSSENRAAYALGRTAYPGGIKVFIAKMNEKAKSLGMTHTQFYDPTGLTISNQSTAEDLTRMVQAAFAYDVIKLDTTTKGADVALGPRYIHHYLNSDALVRIGKFPIFLSKTGFINEAGHCLVLFSKINGKSIVMVFLNSAGKSGRLVDAIAVKNYIQKSGI